MLADFINSFTDFTQNLLSQLGVVGVGIIAFMENIFPLTPSEWLYPLTGKMAYDGDISLIGVILAGGIGSMIGAFTFYHFGKFLGAERTRDFIDRYGTLHIRSWQIPIFTVESYDKATEQFDKRGGIIVMVGRWMPLIHGVISIPAGVVGMPLGRFLIFSFIGTVTWIAPTVLIGYFLGSQWDTMLSILDAYDTVWYIIIALVVVYWLYRRWTKQKA